jgi:integrase
MGYLKGSLKVDPTEGLRLKKSRQTSPLPYTDAEATRILLAARMETKPSLRWAHWIMAFTGMRAGEVLQLLGRDVRQEGDIWCFDINEADPTKSVKTGQRRHVPIHEALIREGFVDYAQTIHPDAPMFPGKGLDRFGNRGGRAWNVIGNWARTRAGITDPKKAPDHSWRHRVEDELRAQEVPEDVRDAITGHARTATGSQ